MPAHSLYLFSPFSEELVAQKNQDGLLVQFILDELFALYNAKNFSHFDLYESLFDWNLRAGPLNKLKEHIRLLSHAFPLLTKEVKAIYDVLADAELHLDNLPNYLKTLYSLLEPFLHACSDSENLLIFLLKNQKAIAQIAGPKSLYLFFLKIFPRTAMTAAQFLVKRFQKRGFTLFLSEIDSLIAELENHAST